MSVCAAALIINSLVALLTAVCSRRRPAHLRLLATVSAACAVAVIVAAFMRLVFAGFGPIETDDPAERLRLVLGYVSMALFVLGSVVSVLHLGFGAVKLADDAESA
jgi:DMSO reductase anchor subunit